MIRLMVVVMMVVLVVEVVDVIGLAVVDVIVHCWYCEHLSVFCKANLP